MKKEKMAATSFGHACILCIHNNGTHSSLLLIGLQACNMIMSTEH